MISKRIHCQAENDHYPRLANYIADASHKGEKALMSWAAGCWSGEDYKLGIQEVSDTQFLNTRTRLPKTYHLIISFRPEDEAKLSETAFKDIERHFAEALGLSEHQRHCGVHKNTDNLHMHVAYNLIHPERLTIHTPFRDYPMLERTCRSMEQAYGLTVDNGKENTRNVRKMTEPAARLEAQTGQQSFEGYAKEHKEAIMQQLASATTWQDVHDTLGQFGMHITPKGNGLAIADAKGQGAMKASTLERSFSLKKMEALFGPFEASKNTITPTISYDKTPIHRGAKRGELFQEYQKAIEAKKLQYDMLKEEESAKLLPIQARWAKERQNIISKSIAQRTRVKLMALAKHKEREEAQAVKEEYQVKRAILRTEYPFNSWANFLQIKAGQGNETALAILRSKDKEVAPEKNIPSVQEIRERHERERAIRERTGAILASGLTRQAQRPLLAVLKMERLLGGQGFTHTIDKKGIVIFTLASGGTIRDTGKEIRFSTHDKEAEKVATLYAKERWGRNVALEGNAIKLINTKERSRGFTR